MQALSPFRTFGALGLISAFHFSGHLGTIDLLLLAQKHKALSLGKGWG